MRKPPRNRFLVPENKLLFLENSFLFQENMFFHVQTWTKDALCSFGQPGYFGLKALKTTEEGQVMYPHHPLGYQNH